MKIRKRPIYTLMLGFALILGNGCKKDNDAKDAETNVATPTLSEYFIEGKVDNVMIRAENVGSGGTSTGSYNDFMNMISMQRVVSSTDFRGWIISIRDVTLDNWQIPDTLDASQIFSQENLSLSYYSGPHESANNYMVDNVVLGDTSFQMIVSSKSGDIVQGTFHGQLRNGSDSDLRVNVTDGKFKIKIVRI